MEDNLSVPYAAAPAWHHNKWLWAIVAVGLVARILFLVAGARFYYGAGNEYVNGDTGSYILSFQNLLHHGTYTFDFMEPEAAFGRLPGYPFFYGIHYLIFGERYAMVATACTQAALDCVSIILVFLIAQRLAPATNRFAPYVAAALYAVYPFIIVWNTVIGTESFATFLTLVWLYTLLEAADKPYYYLLLGLEIALLFYVREFLGIFLPITCLYLFFLRGDKWQRAVRNCTLVCVAFGALYIWWPARNYVYQHRFMLVKPQRAGFANYKTDMVSFLDWVHSWSNQSTYWLQQVLNNPQVDFPADIFASPQEHAQALALVKQAAECGSSFYIYKNAAHLNYSDTTAMRHNQDYMVECNEQLHVGFEQLRQSYKARHPVLYYTKVPLENLYKVFFKSGTQDAGGTSSRRLVPTLLFAYRTVLLLLGVLGLVVFRRRPGMQPIIIYWVFIVVFLCWYFRQLEMRYLIQADVLMLLPAALLLGKWLTMYMDAKRPARLGAVALGGAAGR